MTPRTTLSARLDDVEGTLARLEGKVDSIGLNGSTEHIKALAAAAPALVHLAAVAPVLVERAQQWEDDEAARRVRARRWGWVARLDIARPWIYLGVALASAAAEHVLSTHHLAGF